MNTARLNSQWIYSSVFNLVSPLIRILMGVLTYPQFCEILKLAYVSEAEKFIKRKSRDSRITKSEVSLLTGIDSRQFPSELNFQIVSENQLFLENNSEAERLLYPESYILGVWEMETNFLTPEYRKSKTIPIYGKRHSFESYVRKFYTRGVTIQSVLGRLISSNNIQIVDVDFVTLKNRYYIPVEREYEDLLKIGLNHIRYLSNTVAHNLLTGDTPKLFERCYRSHNTTNSDFSEPSRKIASIFKKQMKQSEKIILDYEEGKTKAGKNFCGVGYYYFELTENS
jgi:hypothetical protein